MKKLSIVSIILLSLFFISLSSLFAQQSSSPVILNKVADNIYMISGGRGANVGVYISETGVMLIDSKQDSVSVSQVLTEIQKLSRNPIEYMVNTHADVDHVFGNRFLPSSVTFVSHENCRKEFFVAGMGGRPSDWDDPELVGFLP